MDTKIDSNNNISIRIYIYIMYNMTFQPLYKNIFINKINILDLDIKNDYESDYESECELVDYTEILKDERYNKYKNNISFQKSKIQKSFTEYKIKKVKYTPMKTLNGAINKLKTF